MDHISYDHEKTFKDLNIIGCNVEIILNSMENAVV